MRRRDLIAMLGGAALTWPLLAEAQQSGKIVKLGFMSPAGAAEYTAATEAFRQGLRDGGFIENKNIEIEYRWAEGRYAALDGFAAEFVAMNVDVIVAHSTPAVQAARRATTTIPIVMLTAADPVGDGLVQTLARPGGNITGNSLALGDEFAGKWVQLLTELVPNLSQLAVLTNPENTQNVKNLREIETAARAVHVEVHAVEMRELDLDRAMASVGQSRAAALIVLPDPVFTTHRQKLSALALQARIPAVYFLREFPEAGGLLSYGPNMLAVWKGGAAYVVKILKGATPASLPVEQPTRFELVINLKTAKALGMTIPESFLRHADDVIE